MKKLVFPLIFILAVGFSSCQKCATCKIITATYETFPEEKCGTSAEVDDFIKEKQKQASQLPDIGARAECIRK